MREKIYILIIEDYDMALEGLISIVREHLQENILSYHIESARSIAEAWHILDAQGRNFDLILTDLQLPNEEGETPSKYAGQQFIRDLLRRFPQTNLMIQTGYLEALRDLIDEFDYHDAGLTIASKNLKISELKIRLDCALKGFSHTRDIRTINKFGKDSKIELNPKWHAVIKLAIEDELTNKRIAEELNMGEANINRIWDSIRSALGLYKEPGKNYKVATIKALLKEGIVKL